ncbi:hypothetical protein HanXRQr2_Chr12g0560621 [Helianthus annuus]|uniref:Uncharacterized protein n=1 Tax=Helianthus annuus TaxID=4232 RepID=A0A251UG10_HELAN|nr:hypothetical protein HanXRQr2_Chr12g0560621 [Helianthus annuus]
MDAGSRTGRQTMVVCKGFATSQSILMKAYLGCLIADLKHYCFHPAQAVAVEGFKDENKESDTFCWSKQQKGCPRFGSYGIEWL